MKKLLICVLIIGWWAAPARAQIASQLWYNQGGICTGITPDPSGAISPHFIVAKANACISITGRSPADIATLQANSLCSGNMTGDTCVLTDNVYWGRTGAYTDGHVYWDQVSQRWYIIELNVDTNHLQTAFSDGDNPLAMHQTDIIPPPGDVGDYPQMGFNAKWLSISMRFAGGSTDSSILYIWSKQDTFNNGQFNANPLITNKYTNEQDFILPCEGQSSAFGALWFVRNHFQSNQWWMNQMMLSNVTGAETAPVWAENAGLPTSNFWWHQFDPNSVSQQKNTTDFPVPNGGKATKPIQCIQQGGPNGNTLYFTNTGEVPVPASIIAANSALQPQVIEADSSESNGRTEGNISYMELGNSGGTDLKRAGDMMFAFLSPGGGYSTPPVVDGNDGIIRSYHQAVFDTGSLVNQATDQFGDIITSSMVYSPFYSNHLFNSASHYVDIDTSSLYAPNEMAGTLIDVRNVNQNPWFYSSGNPVMHAVSTWGQASSYVTALQDQQANTSGLYVLEGSPKETNGGIGTCAGADESSLDYTGFAWNPALYPSIFNGAGGGSNFPGSLADPPLIVTTPFGNIPGGTNYLWAQQYIPSDNCYIDNNTFSNANAGITIPLYPDDHWATFFWSVPINHVNDTFAVGTYGAGFSANVDSSQSGFITTTDPFLGVDSSGNQVIGFGRVSPWVYYGTMWARVAAGQPYPGVSAFHPIQGTQIDYGNRTGDYCHAGWDPSIALYWFCAAESSPSGVGWQLWYDYGI